jgi:hypothetical protein
MLEAGLLIFSGFEHFLAPTLNNIMGRYSNEKIKEMSQARDKITGYRVDHPMLSCSGPVLFETFDEAKAFAIATMKAYANAVENTVNSELIELDKEEEINTRYHNHSGIIIDPIITRYRQY